MKILASLLLAAMAAFSQGSVKTDYGVYPAPSAPPSLPSAGSSVVDPVFGTRIIRVTDDKDGFDCGTVYSYWPNFNKDSTWMMVACQQYVSTWIEPVAVFYRWSASGQWTEKRVKAISGSPEGLNLSVGIWSGVDPNVLIVSKSQKLYSYNVAANTAALIKDFSADFPGEYIWQWHRSVDDDVFSFTRKRSSDYATVGYAVWRRSTNAIIYSVTTSQLDEVQVDKTGRWLTVKTGQSGANAVEGKIVDLSTGSVRNLLDGAPDYNLGHSDNGSGIQVGEENWNGGIWKYGLSGALKVDLMPGYSMWKLGHNGGHYSMLADDEGWVLASTNDGTGALASEIYQLSTDGSGKLRRLAHHYSVYRGYEDTPRPNISRDGKWVAFTSNWGGRSRRDVFVLQVPQLSAPQTDSITLSLSRAAPSYFRIWLDVVSVSRGADGTYPAVSGALMYTRNGLVLTEGADYSISSSRLIPSIPWLATDKIIARKIEISSY